MAKRSGPSIFSIFGQIESVVADQMVAEGVAYRIAFDDIPPTARFNQHDQPAYCGLIMSPDVLRAFEKRVRDLRA